MNDYYGNIYEKEKIIDRNGNRISNGSKVETESICGLNFGVCSTNYGNCGIFAGSCKLNKSNCWVDGSIN